MEIQSRRETPPAKKSDGVLRKGLIATALALVLGSCPGWAQSQFEIAAFAGYQFWGNQDVQQGKINIKDTGNYGGAIAYRVRSNLRAEFFYLYQPTTLRLTNRATGTTEDLFDMAVHYLQVGGMYEMQSGGQVAPFGGVTIGVANFDPKAGSVSSEWRFAFGLTGGLKIMLSEKVGLRGQGHLLFPIQWGGGGLWCGLGGCNVGVGGTTSIIQGALTGGLFVKL